VAEDIDPVNSDLLQTLTVNYRSDYTIDVHQVTQTLLSINVNNVTGPDFLPNRILRYFATLIAEPLSHRRI